VSDRRPVTVGDGLRLGCGLAFWFFVVVFILAFLGAVGGM